MQIFVSSFGNNTITIDVNGSDTICDVKYSVEEKLGIPSNFQKFRFGGRQLIDLCSLNDQKIHQESTLQLFLHLRGGMHKFRSIRIKKPAGEESSPEALGKCGTSILDEDVQDKPINQVSTTKDTHSRIVAEIRIDGLDAAVAPPHEKECKESAQEMLEDFTRREGTEKQPHMKSLVDFNLSRACKAGRNDTKAGWFAKKI